MQGRNPSTAIPDPDQKRKQRLRMLRNCTIVVLVVVLIVLAVNLVRYFTRSRSIGVYSLPCFAHQDVTVFRDGVVYYDGESIHCVGATGTVLWSYPVGSGASFSVSDKYLIAWSGTQLFIVNENGRPTYNEPMASEIQFARIGNTRAVIVLGDEINPEVMMVDLNGQLLDSEKGVFEGKMLLDCGFFGTGEEYCWTLSADVYSPALATYLHTFQVNKMNTGNVNLGDHLVYKVFYTGSKLYVFDTQQLTTYDYRGVQDTSGSQLIYGWRLMNHSLSARRRCCSPPRTKPAAKWRLRSFACWRAALTTTSPCRPPASARRLTAAASMPSPPPICSPARWRVSGLWRTPRRSRTGAASPR